MIYFFGQSIIFWTGVLAGLLSFFSFLGCRCLFGKKFPMCRINFFVKNHNLLMWLAFITVIIHITFAILASLGVYL